MNRFAQVPMALKIVAGLFFLGGASSAIKMAMALNNGRLDLDFGILGLLIGYGLLMLQSGARTCALAWSAIGMVAVPIVVIVLLGTTEPAQIRIFGYAYHFASKLPALTGLSAMFLLFWWQYRVLKRTDIQALFKRSLQN